MMPTAMLIAVVDDDQPFRDSMRKLISSLGYTVEVFSSAAEFLASPLVSKTTCLVTDVHMPGMTGDELHRRLIDQGRQIPTILITAYPDEITRSRAIRDGAVCYLSKPLDDHQLEHCLRSALAPVAPI